MGYEVRIGQNKLELYCIKCSKPTRSHKLEDGSVICHRCWLEEQKDDKNG